MTRDKRPQGDDPPGHTESGPPSGAIRFPTSGPTGGPSKVCPTPHPESQGQGYIAQESHGGVGENMTAEVATKASESHGPVNEPIPARRIELFRDYMVRTGRSPSTAKSYSKYLNLCAKAVGTDPTLWEREHLDALLGSDTWRGWSPMTRNIAKASLLAFWKHLERDAPKHQEFDGLRARPYGQTKSARYERLRQQAPTQEEVEKVRAFCRDLILASTSKDDEVYSAFATYMVAAYGLRCVDAASIRVCDVRLEEGVIHVPLGKGSKARDVPIDVPLTDLYPIFMSARSSIVNRLGHVFTKPVSQADLADTSPLFFVRVVNRGQGSIGGNAAEALQALIPHLVRNALGRHVNAHAFRHAKVFELMERGVEPVYIQRYMGHATVDQTLDYAWTDVQDIKRAIVRADAKGQVQAQAQAPATPAPQAGVLETLATLNRAGTLTDSAFAAAVAALAQCR